MDRKNWLEIKIADWVIHQFRNNNNREYKGADKLHWDIALVKLAEEVDLTVHTPICLPVLGQDYVSPDRKSGELRWATTAGKGS